jgi:ketosteroid isomerase-like protein
VPGPTPTIERNTRGDVAAVANLYSPDAQLVMSGSAPVRGQAGIRTAIETMIKSGVKVQFGSEQNIGSGDLAYVHGHYTVLDHDGGKPVEEGSYLEL